MSAFRITINGGNQMATIGQALTVPEAGWKRINNSDSLITYIGPNWQVINGGHLTYVATNTIQFSFTGNKIRVIAGYDPNWAATKVNIIIDGVSYIYDQSVGGAAPAKLLFEKNDLQNGNHIIVITGTDSVNASHWFGLYAIDIDDKLAISSPTSLIATAGDSQVTLSWTSVTGAIGYNIKRSTTASGPYTTIATNVTGTTYIDKTVTNGITYYYVVTAVDSDGNESANSNEASATPQAPSGHGLLRITMNDSSEREYQLSHDEINKFIEWCDRTVGTGKTLYVFDKTYNVGEFKSRKEYLLFEKIISFEVMELTK
jgi:hypothetical protein